MTSNWNQTTCIALMSNENETVVLTLNIDNTEESTETVALTYVNWPVAFISNMNETATLTSNVNIYDLHEM